MRKGTKKKELMMTLVAVEDKRGKPHRVILKVIDTVAFFGVVSKKISEMRKKNFPLAHFSKRRHYYFRISFFQLAWGNYCKI